MESREEGANDKTKAPKRKKKNLRRCFMVQQLIYSRSALIEKLMLLRLGKRIPPLFFPAPDAKFPTMHDAIRSISKTPRVRVGLLPPHLQIKTISRAATPPPHPTLPHS